MLDRFPRLRPRLHTAAGLLSGGEQQMLAVARGLLARPEVLLLDEPSLGLAPAVVAELFEQFTRLRDEGMTLLIVDQMADLCAGHCRPRLCARRRPRGGAGQRRGAARCDARRCLSRCRSGGGELMDLIIRDARILREGELRQRRYRHSGHDDRGHLSGLGGGWAGTESGGLPGGPRHDRDAYPSRQDLHPRPLPHRGRHRRRSRPGNRGGQARLHRRGRLCAGQAHAGTLHHAGHDAHAHPCRARSGHRHDRLRGGRPARARLRLGDRRRTMRVSRRRGSPTIPAPKNC